MQLRSGKTYTYVPAQSQPETQPESQHQFQTDLYNFKYQAKKLMDEFNNTDKGNKLLKIKLAGDVFDYFIENKQYFNDPIMDNFKQILYPKYIKLSLEAQQTINIIYAELKDSHNYMTRLRLKRCTKYNSMVLYAERLFRQEEQIWRIANSQ